jgi:type IV pilus assembly protein PilA
MLSKLQKLKTQKSEQGFTIIEVMIVLAIAGLIILIVLLAVPALQRNARNTAIKQDASSITSSINEFKSNNEGLAPDTVTSTTAGVVSVTNAAVAGTGTTTGKIQGGTTITQVLAAATAPVASNTSNGVVYVYYQHTCDAAGVVNKRAVSVYYPVENTGGTPTLKCIDA